MTAASRHLSSSRPRGRLSLSRRIERLLLVFVACVPVPALALSGLAIPLPGVVERIGAALVPWANVATLDEHSLAAATTRGKIVLAPSQTGTVDALELTTVEPGAARPASPAAPRRRSAAAGAYTAGPNPVVPTDTGEPETTPTAADEPTGDPAPAPDPTPAPTLTEPSPPSADPGPGPPADTAPPTVDPVPDREPTKPDVKPVDPDVKPLPGDEVDPVPPLPVPPLPVPTPIPVDTDVKPVVETVDKLVDQLLDQR